MRVLAIDIGSSSVKVAVLTGRKPKQIERQPFATRYAGDRAEVSAATILAAVKKAIAGLGDAARHVDVIVPTGMSPSWLAMDAAGRAITPVVTHQDRRSHREAVEIEAAVGRARHLHLTGNRPTPGGISSTTARWFVRHTKPAMKNADLVGHLNTWLIRLLTGERVTDPSNASFTGLYRTTNLGGWDGDLIAAARVNGAWLPRVIDANETAGRVTAAGARRFGVTAGTPVLAGFVDGSGGLLAIDAKAGQVLNVIGSTDVLAVVTDRARPLEGLLTRALGVGRRWVSVATISAAGSAIAWTHQNLFADHNEAAFYKLVATLSSQPTTSAVSFDATLAGSRTAIEVASGSITGLTLGTGREEILAAMLNSLAVQSAERFKHFAAARISHGRHALTTGGGDRTLARLFRRDWPGEWTFESIEEATLAGAWKLAESIL
ncbi:MAG: FGGY-family carbohydrate kinase [Tepidisphaeraceae bacterium]